MRTTLIIWALMLCTAIATAQENKKIATVRVKKIEKINGVEKVTDTTYVTSDFTDTGSRDGELNFSECKGKDGKVKKIVIINDDMKDVQRFIERDSSGIKTVIIGSSTDKAGQPSVRKLIIDDPSFKDGERTIYINRDAKLTEEEEKALMESAATLRTAHKDLEAANNDLRIAHRQLSEAGAQLRKAEGLNYEKIAKIESMNGEKAVRHFIIIRSLNVAEMTMDERSTVEKTTGMPDGKLAVEEIKFYPNPNDGRFNLSFNLKERGDTEVSIIDMQGKKIYDETIKDFTGHYEKHIDISSNPQGSYFLSVKQGNHSQLKKIVLD